jgi:hypothetical protein
VRPAGTLPYGSPSGLHGVAAGVVTVFGRSLRWWIAAKTFTTSPIRIAPPMIAMTALAPSLR